MNEERYANVIVYLMHLRFYFIRWRDSRLNRDSRRLRALKIGRIAGWRLRRKSKMELRGQR